MSLLWLSDPDAEELPFLRIPIYFRLPGGTQQIEREVHRLFPQARVLRMDYDTTRTRESYEQILSAFGNGQADILVGTQMIVKGHDFPDVTLVGIVAATFHCMRLTIGLQSGLFSF